MKRIVVLLTLGIFLLMTGVSFGWVASNCTITSVKQDSTGIYIGFDNGAGWVTEKMVSTAAGVEKNILAVALTAQAGGNTVDLTLSYGEITGLKCK